MHVDVRPVSDDFHHSFHTKQWLLLPETSIIDAYYNAETPSEFPNINADRYKYKLIAHENMLRVAIHRQKRARTDPPDPPKLPPSKDGFTFYSYPYHDFPTIESRVHPRFVVCNSGLKLENETHKYYSGYETSITDLSWVYEIWRKWSQATPTEEFLKKTLDGGDLDIKDNNSEQTAPWRILRSARPKRRAAGEQDSPTPKSSKQRTLQVGVTWLDDETLHEFDRQTSSQNDHNIPKNQRIQEWLRGFSDSKCTTEAQGKFVGGHEDAVVIT